MFKPTYRGVCYFSWSNIINVNNTCIIYEFCHTLSISVYFKQIIFPNMSLNKVFPISKRHGNYFQFSVL